MKKNLISLFCFFLCSVGLADELSWKVIVVNAKTNEVKEFFPANGTLFVPSPKPFSCAIQPEIFNSTTESTTRLRELTCKYSGVTSALVVSCGRDNKNDFVFPGAGTWLGFNKSGEHAVSIIVTCQ
jgi:hypothetical protein